MSNLKQDILLVTVNNGSTYGKAQKVLEPGTYVAVAVYKGAQDNNNPGVVRASIKNQGGEYIAQPVNIDDYRSREAEYVQGAKPIRVTNGGTQVTIEITAEQAFTAQTDFDFVFIAVDAQL